MRFINSSNLLTIKAETPNPNIGKAFQAYIQDEVDFSVQLHYDTIFQEVLNWKGKLNQLLGGAEVLAPETVENSMGGIFSQGLAWTRKFGGIPEYITTKFRCVMVNYDSDEEIFQALNLLYDITVPRVAKGIARIPQMVVSISVGGWLMFQQCFVDDIHHKFSKISTNGVPLSVELDLSVTTMYAVDRDLLGVSGKKITVKTLANK
jgi:hypothetical protein